MEYSIENVDQANTPSAILETKAAARRRIEEFLCLTVEGMLLQPYKPEVSGGVLEVYDAESARARLSDTPNRRLANAMLGLQGAVRTICQVDPPMEEGESLTAKRIIVDGISGDIKKYKISAWAANLDFGTNLACKYDTRGIVDANGRRDVDYDFMLLPQDHYLFNVLRLGDPHEPLFFASETDTYSAEWSSEKEERLPNGGITAREINLRRALYDNYGNYSGGERLTDKVYHRHRVEYGPLYGDDAPGIEKYVEITQGLLRKFLDAAAGNHKIKASL